MADIIKKIKEKLDHDIEDIMDLRQDALWLKTDTTFKALVALFKKLDDSIDEILDKKASDKLGDHMKTLMVEIKDVVKGLKFPELKQQINFDTKPLVSLNENIKKQNDNISELIKKIPKENSDGGVSRELLQMIARNNEFISRATQQYDYSKVLKEIADRLNRKEEIKFPTLKVERQYGLIQKLIPVT